ncbi:MAG: hypothetical protein MJ131_11150 [Lachnospiraceae bacterium]|nr:hypothetical protein [Lachnospiraceae bacterium]
MNRTTAIVCLVILLAFLAGTIKVLLPTFKKFVHRMPKSIFIVLFVMIAAAMIWLIVFIVDDVTGGGQTGGNEQDNNTVEQEAEKPPIENCIIVRGTDIIIENMQADIVSAGKYIDYRVENNIELTVVDDYSVSSVYRGIIDLCKKKGVRYTTENEAWLEKQ